MHFCRVLCGSRDRFGCYIVLVCDMFCYVCLNLDGAASVDSWARVCCGVCGVGGVSSFSLCWRPVYCYRWLCVARSSVLRDVCVVWLVK